MHAAAPVSPHKVEAPRFVVSVETVEVAEGDTTKLYCRAIGCPVPDIIWYKSGRQIKQDNRFLIEYGDSDCESTLVVVDIKSEHAGHYTAEACNDVGSAYSEAALFVLRRKCTSPHTLSVCVSLHFI